MAGKPAGRPSKFNQETAQKILASLKMGAHFAPACLSANIAPRTVAEWIQIGEGKHPTRKQRPELIQFAQDLKAIEVQAEFLLVSRVRQAAESDWRAAMWLLTRRWPERWASTTYIRVIVEKWTHKLSNRLCQAIICDGMLDQEAKTRVLQIIASLDKTPGDLTDL